MTLQQLNYIITISETGSFNKAADRLYVSQPSLTSAVKELEKEIGILIFNRSGKGVTLTAEGLNFLPYARQVYSQYQNLLDVYSKQGKRKRQFAVSTQHYSFAVKAFVELTKTFDVAEYEFAIRETRTKDVMDDVASSRSEIGILYLNDFNRRAILKLLSSANLQFTPLIRCDAYVYLWKGHPLAGAASISFADLAPYPCVSFEQGDNSNFYLSEEILPTNDYPRGIICEELNGGDYVAVPYQDADGSAGQVMEIGYITRKNSILSPVGERYIEEISKYLGLDAPSGSSQKA